MVVTGPVSTVGDDDVERAAETEAEAAIQTVTANKALMATTLGLAAVGDVDTEGIAGEAFACFEGTPLFRPRRGLSDGKMKESPERPPTCDTRT
jgi:hypothetical protein